MLQWLWYGYEIIGIFSPQIYANMAILVLMQ